MPSNLSRRDLLKAGGALAATAAAPHIGLHGALGQTPKRGGTISLRLWEVSRARVADVYVNIQGDEPLVTTGHIETLVRPFLQEPEVQVTTLKIRATPEEVQSRTANKVVSNVHGDALYFSRLPIPFDRDEAGDVVHWKHVGMYAYRRAVLDTFHSLPHSSLERAENLEQLRLLEHGIPIRVLETRDATIGVDTEADLKAVAALVASRSS